MLLSAQPSLCPNLTLGCTPSALFNPLPGKPGPCPLLSQRLACPALSLPFPVLMQLLACQTLSLHCFPPALPCCHSSVALQCLDFTQHLPCKTFAIPIHLSLNPHRALPSPHSALALLPCCSQSTLCRARLSPCAALPSLAQPFALPFPPLALSCPALAVSLPCTALPLLSQALHSLSPRPTQPFLAFLLNPCPS
jgi:hypothetical protein